MRPGFSLNESTYPRKEPDGAELKSANNVTEIAVFPVCILPQAELPNEKKLKKNSNHQSLNPAIRHGERRMTDDQCH
jgi:hypothetical protein